MLFSHSPPTPSLIIATLFSVPVVLTTVDMMCYWNHAIVPLVSGLCYVFMAHPCCSCMKTAFLLKAEQYVAHSYTVCPAWSYYTSFHLSVNF